MSFQNPHIIPPPSPSILPVIVSMALVIAVLAFLVGLSLHGIGLVGWGLE